MMSAHGIERYFSDPKNFKQIILGGNGSLKLYLDSGGFSEISYLSVNPKKILNNENIQDYLINKCINVLNHASKCSAYITFTYDIPIIDETPPSMYRIIQQLNEKSAIFMLDRKPACTKLFAIAHGWDYKSVLHAAKKLKDFSFDGLAVASPLSRIANFNKRVEFACALAAAADDDTETHYLGAAGIIDFYVIALLGISSCDSKAYSEHARFRKYLLPQTGQRIAIGFNNKTERKFRLKELPCMCPSCYEAKIFTRKNNLVYESDFYAEKGSERGAKLALHNLYVLFNELSLINEAMTSRSLFKKLLSNRVKANDRLKWALKVLVSFCRKEKKLRMKVPFFELLKDMI
mgnify:CR=1 FL=1